MKPFLDPEVCLAFEAFPQEIRTTLMLLRELIFETAAQTEGVGDIKETLKWGQPSYLTPVTKSGSTVRLGYPKGQTEQAALYFHCQTNLVATFRMMFGTLHFEGKRAILLAVNQKLPVDQLKQCIALALTNHRQ